MKPMVLALGMILMDFASMTFPGNGQTPLQVFKASPAYFIPNTAQAKTGRKLVEDDQVVAFVQTRQGRVLFTPAGAFIGMTAGPAPVSPPPPGGRLAGEAGLPAAPVRQTIGGAATPGSFARPRQLAIDSLPPTVVMGVGFGTTIQKNRAGRAVSPQLTELMPARLNFFLGSRENWRTDVPAYRKLIYPDVWPGIDVEYIGYMDKLEYRLIVHPGANPAAVVMETGADSLLLDEGGNLTAILAGAALRMSRPSAWQEQNGRQPPVDVQFKPMQEGRYGFAVASYDSSRDLIIDPVLSWSTYLGTDGRNELPDDTGIDIAVDTAGNAYVAGHTYSSNFTVTAGSYDTAYNGGSDVFVTKLNADGSALVYSTLIGGIDYDWVSGLEVDTAGNAYVTGNTKSSDFPVTAGSYDTTYSGGSDVFVTKLNADGSALVYSTLINDISYSSVGGIAVDAAGNAYVTGSTYSSDFPVTAGSYDTAHNGGSDVFITKLNESGSALVYSTFLGGGNTDVSNGIVFDTSGNVYVTGFTYSSDFPVTAGAYDTTLNHWDAFVTKLNADGSALVFSTYIGGGSLDHGYGIAVDTAGNTYVTGLTTSSDFPVVAGSYDTIFNGGSDVFVTKLNAAGSALVYSTLIGSSKDDSGSCIVVDTGGNAYVTGVTNSSGFPVTAGSYDTAFNGEDDIFITKLDAAGSALVYSTFLGGDDFEKALSIVADSAGNVFITGWTQSFNFPVTAGVYDPSPGYHDAFVTKLNAGGQSLGYSTFLNGNGHGDYGRGIAADGSGNVYVTGYTLSVDFPVTTGAYDTARAIRHDVYITKLNTTGSALVYSTFIGGSQDDFGYGIAVDTSGNAYVTGWTESSDFPVTAGAYDAILNGRDAFVTKLNAAGSALVYSTYIGGGFLDYGYGIAVDSAGNAYIAGDTKSSNFPVTAGAYDTSHNGESDAFVTKLNAAGSALIYSTFIGGTYGEYARGIVVDTAGNAFVTGQTASSGFPVTPGAYDADRNNFDAFVTKLNAAGSALVYSTFIGGNDFDDAWSIAVDTIGNAYVAGLTRSSDFPATSGSYDTSYNGGSDAFVTKLNAAGSALVYSTFLGGMNADRANGIAVDTARNVCLTGYTLSSGFPVTEGSYDTAYNGKSDAFVTKLNAAGSALVYSTFAGGSEDDAGYGIAVDDAGSVYVTGDTNSAVFPVTAGAYDTINTTGADAFLMKLSWNFTAGGLLGVGVQNPQRALHLAGPNAVFRMDRLADASAFLMVRTDAAGLPQKAFLVGTEASGVNQGQFIFKDMDTSVADGAGTARLTIGNDGTAAFTGNVKAKGFVTTSTARLKENTGPLENAAEKLGLLHGVRFRWKENPGLLSGMAGGSKNQALQPAAGEDLGFIARDVAAVIPEAVTACPAGSLGVDYGKLLPVIIEILKQQQAQLDALARQRDAIRKQLLDLTAKKQ